MDEFLVFSTHYRENPDYNESDSLAEMNQLIVRQRIIQDCISSGNNADILFDLLEEQDIDSAEYVETVEQNVDFVINQGLILTPSV